MRTLLKVVGPAAVVAACSASPDTRAGGGGSPRRDTGTTDEHQCGPVRTGSFSNGDPNEWVAVAGQQSVVVRVDGATAPIAGSMVDHEGELVFRPTFPFTPGLTYQIHGDGCTTNFTVTPPRSQEAPTVVDIYPRTAQIPENVLRFYIYFSQPMAEGNFLEHIRLEHVESGEDLTGVFFDNIYELWSADHTRITVLVDPGRVKTGLLANQKMGRAFKQGQSYRLKVLPTWTTIDGRPLASAATKSFDAIPEDRVAVNPHAWTLTLPQTGTRQQLLIEFGEPVDHVSVHQFIRVRSPSHTLLEGRWTLSPDDTQASWTPHKPWVGTLSAHELLVSGRFEDIAANNLNAAFDHSVGELRSDENQTVVRKFGSVSGSSATDTGKPAGK